MMRLGSLTCSLACLYLLLAVPGPVMAQGTLSTVTIQQLAGEEYLYAMDFMIFSRLARGELHLKPTDRPDVFRAELVGKTLGIASWLAGDRSQVYTSLMELAGDGTLRSIEHVSTIDKRRWGKWQRKERRYRYDYQAGKIYDEKRRDGRATSQVEHDIPHGMLPVDMLTAFYNLRTGAYGPMRHGADLRIPTYSHGKFTEIEAHILTVEQQAARKDFPAGGFLIQVRIDPEVFDTKSGSMLFWIDGQGVPARGIVEDLIGLGDVLGYLDSEAAK